MVLLYKPTDPNLQSLMFWETSRNKLTSFFTEAKRRHTNNAKEQIFTTIIIVSSKMISITCIFSKCLCLLLSFSSIARAAHNLTLPHQHPEPEEVVQHVQRLALFNSKLKQTKRLILGFAHFLVFFTHIFLGTNRACLCFSLFFKVLLIFLFSLPTFLTFSRETKEHSSAFPCFSTLSLSSPTCILPKQTNNQSADYHFLPFFSH